MSPENTNEDAALELPSESAGDAGPENQVGATAAQLARQILANHRISLGSRHPSGVQDNATPDREIAATARGEQAARSSYGAAPGGTVALDRRMLQAILKLAETYSFHITELAGGSHSAGSRHYAGIALDVGRINGSRVSAGNPHWRAFIQKGRSLGATQTLGPGDPGHSTHIHLAWPRATTPSGDAALPESASEAVDMEEAVCCEAEDGDPDAPGSAEEQLESVLAVLEGERARLSIVGRSLLPEEQARMDAVTAAAFHVREALTALSGPDRLS